MLDQTTENVVDDAPGLAVLPEQLPPASSVDEWLGLRCEKCAVPIKSDGVTICRQCGWYASLGTYLEVDPNYDFEQLEAAKQSPAPVSHARVWFDLIPWWGWVIVGSVLAVVVESVVVRLVTPEGIGGLRTSWSLSQLALGVALLFGCHIFSFVVLAAEDSDFGLLDIVLKPLKIWLRAFNRLPTRLWVSDGAAVGLTAIVMSLTVIGAIPYDRLWDWGLTPPPKQDLMGAVVDRAKQVKGNGADNLEDAIGDFAGTADAVTDSAADAKKAEAKRKKADCVILGYRIDKEGRLTQLLLGTAHLGKLVYAGTVTPKLSDDEKAALLQTLVASRAHQPFIRIEAEANWVKPKLACRVTYVEVDSTGRLIDLKWDSLVGKMRL